MTSGDRSILVLNSGSSSLKVGVFLPGHREEQSSLEGSADGIGRPGGSLQLKSGDRVLLEEKHTIASQEEALQHLASALREHLPAPLEAVGHRVVHGGPHLREHQKITPGVLAQLEAAVHFAPLHIPEALRIIRKAQELFPAVPQFACFDTTFHKTMPAVATHLPLPARFYTAGVQRYGFHGLSCESIMHQLGSAAPQRIVIAHLGSGSSVTAVRDGKSIDTSMGMSPTGGVPMSTRTGDLDPGVLLYLLRTEQLSADALEHLVNHECGLAGLSDGESDMQALLLRVGEGDPAASLAVDVFATDVKKTIGGYGALMGGIDLLVFTGGIGEHSSDIRTRICQGLESFGLQSSAAGDIGVTVLPAQEDLQIARHTRRLCSLEDAR